MNVIFLQIAKLDYFSRIQRRNPLLHIENVLFDCEPDYIYCKFGRTTENVRNVQRAIFSHQNQRILKMFVQRRCKHMASTVQKQRFIAALEKQLVSRVHGRLNR